MSLLGTFIWSALFDQDYFVALICVFQMNKTVFLLWQRFRISCVFNIVFKANIKGRLRIYSLLKQVFIEKCKITKHTMLAWKKHFPVPFPMHPALGLLLILQVAVSSTRKFVLLWVWEVIMSEAHCLCCDVSTAWGWDTSGKIVAALCKESSGRSMKKPVLWPKQSGVSQVLPESLCTTLGTWLFSLQILICFKEKERKGIGGMISKIFSGLTFSSCIYHICALEETHQTPSP